VLVRGKGEKDMEGGEREKKGEKEGLPFGELSF